MDGGRSTTGRRRAVGGAACGAVLLFAGVSGCVTKEDAKKMIEALQTAQPSRPDVLPAMLNRDIPVRYPPALYARKAQGNVTLRIFIDSAGRVHPESTVVTESSGEKAFDSAAVVGVRDLRFSPARRQGAAVAVSILFPIYFRHPQGMPVPGDSVLRRGADNGPTGAAGTTQSPPPSGRRDDSTGRAHAPQG
jgi:TonB family protein